VSRVERFTQVIDQVSVWSGKTIAWLIVPMFAVLVYEVLLRKFWQPVPMCVFR